MALAGHPNSLQLRLPAASLGLDVVSALLATIVFLHSKRSLLCDGEYCLVSLMLERREEALHAAAA